MGGDRDRGAGTLERAWNHFRARAAVVPALIGRRVVQQQVVDELHELPEAGHLLALGPGLHAGGLRPHRGITRSKGDLEPPARQVIEGHRSLCRHHRIPQIHTRDQGPNADSRGVQRHRRKGGACLEQGHAGVVGFVHGVDVPQDVESGFIGTHPSCDQLSKRVVLVLVDAETDHRSRRAHGAGSGVRAKLDTTCHAFRLIGG
jgi:hypothetical protein